MQLLLAVVPRGNTDTYCMSGLDIFRDQGMRYDAGFAVLNLMR